MLQNIAKVMRIIKHARSLARGSHIRPTRWARWPAMFSWKPRLTLQPLTPQNFPTALLLIKTKQYSKMNYHSQRKPNHAFFQLKMHETYFVEFHMSDFTDSNSRPCAFESGPEWPFFAGSIGKFYGYIL